MSNITLKFKTFGGDEMIVAGAAGVYILESEGMLPSAVIKFDSHKYDAINKYDICEMSHEGRLFFVGRIRTVSTCCNEMEVELSTYVTLDVEPPKEKSAEDDIFEKFKAENPGLFTHVANEEFTRIGDTRNPNVLAPESEPVDMEHEILDGTLKIEKSNSLPIGEVNLEISSSWISKCSGSIALASRIANKFKLGKINTLTPKKLSSSWPSFGDKIAGPVRSTKYYIGASRLTPVDTLAMQPIPVADDIPKVSINKHTFDGKLTLAWEYDQYMTETINAKIVNKLAPCINKKDINVNLRNVQEYVENEVATSFFRTKNGRLILTEILKSVGNCIALSMRNIKISFEIAGDAAFDDNLDCFKWISVRGINCKITNIERTITPFERRVKITAMGFENQLPRDIFVENINITADEPHHLHSEDILQDIVIQNDGDEQYAKLLEYISSMKFRDIVTKSNYKQLITRFLNENSTKIRVIAKPLKTKHCDKKLINIAEPLHFLGKEQL
ncbi:MAG: hypothetical protein LBF56_03765 [Holosporales bacterium]|jgi:hypothetical protein|nr:hypothetical protein [Holosporales bacterium]